MPVSTDFAERLWSGAIGGAIGGGLLLAAKYAVDYWVSVATTPCLSIDYLDTEPGYRVPTSAKAKDEARGTTTTYDAMYVSVSIVNQRRQTAKKCRGFLVGIDIVEDGRYYATDYCDSIPLAWSYRPDADAREGVDIPKDVTQFLNVFWCCQEEMGTGFRPCTIPSTLRSAALARFTIPGEFRFRIQVSADNVETQFFGLRVKWAEAWPAVWRSNCKLLSVRQDTTVFDKLVLHTRAESG